MQRSREAGAGGYIPEEINKDLDTLVGKKTPTSEIQEIEVDLSDTEETADDPSRQYNEAETKAKKTIYRSAQAEKNAGEYQRAARKEVDKGRERTSREALTQGLQERRQRYEEAKQQREIGKLKAAEEKTKKEGVAKEKDIIAKIQTSRSGSDANAQKGGAAIEQRLGGVDQAKRNLESISNQLDAIVDEINRGKFGVLVLRDGTIHEKSAAGLIEGWLQDRRRKKGGYEIKKLTFERLVKNEQLLKQSLESIQVPKTEQYPKYYTETRIETPKTRGTSRAPEILPKTEGAKFTPVLNEESVEPTSIKPGLEAYTYKKRNGFPVETAEKITGLPSNLVKGVEAKGVPKEDAALRDMLKKAMTFSNPQDMISRWSEEKLIRAGQLLTKDLDEDTTFLGVDEATLQKLSMAVAEARTNKFIIEKNPVAKALKKPAGLYEIKGREETGVFDKTPVGTNSDIAEDIDLSDLDQPVSALPKRTDTLPPIAEENLKNTGERNVETDKIRVKKKEIEQASAGNLSEKVTLILKLNPEKTENLDRALSLLSSADVAIAQLKTLTLRQVADFRERLIDIMNAERKKGGNTSKIEQLLSNIIGPLDRYLGSPDVGMPGDDEVKTEKKPKSVGNEKEKGKENPDLRLMQTHLRTLRTQLNDLLSSRLEKISPLTPEQKLTKATAALEFIVTSKLSKMIEDFPGQLDNELSDLRIILLELIRDITPTLSQKKASSTSINQLENLKNFYELTRGAHNANVDRLIARRSTKVVDRRTPPPVRPKRKALPRQRTRTKNPDEAAV